jgi:chorismate lyase
VKPVRIGLLRANQDENQPLQIAGNRLAYVREVILACDDQAVVFAHSVLSLASLRGPWAALTRLGTKPLGEALFSNPRVIRGRLQYRRIPLRHPLARQAARAGISNNNAPLWARRSLFTLQGHPIMVTEIFLRDIKLIKHD